MGAVARAMRGLPPACLVLVACLFAFLPRLAPAAPDTRPTKILTFTKIVDPKAFRPGGEGGRTEPFRIDPELGETWVAYYYVGALVDESKDGVTSFDVGPTFTPKDVASAFVAFESATMSRPVAKPGLTIQYAGVTLELTAKDLERHLGKAGYEAYLKALEHPSNVRHLVELRRYRVPRNEAPEVLASVVRLENMKPISLEIVVGQGALPKEMQEFMKQANGSWIFRHRMKLLVIASVALIGGIVLWRLRR